MSPTAQSLPAPIASKRQAGSLNSRPVERSQSNTVADSKTTVRGEWTRQEQRLLGVFLSNMPNAFTAL